MQRRSRLWIIPGLVIVVLAALVWRFTAREDSRPTKSNSSPSAKVEYRHEPVAGLGALNYAQQPVLPSTNAAAAAKGTNGNVPLLAYRLKNTEKPLKELMYSDSAILLRNALFDAAEPAPLQIPAHLMSQGDPGSFVVQARGPVDQAFLARLKAAGAEIISYIPNNAYLVRGNQAAANQLSTAPETQSILPWEPYFKLDLSLLGRAINQEPLPDDARLTLVVFPGERDAGLKAVQDLGGHLLGEDRSPFGHQMIIQPRPDSLVPLAQLPIVQSIEPYHGRVLANDLARVRVSVATNTLPATPNYLGLSGSNVLVSINDTGVEDAHPDLNGRVIGRKTDPDGHGTHVAGTIASSGLNSPKTNAPGSTNGATFRGIAYNAKLFSQPIDLITGPLVSDSVLQESVALTNVFISNNSWTYGIPEYNQNAASYDAAVRDALPGVAGSSPVVFVFAAGNSGGADFDGRGVRSDQISSPGTAKNVITVGAMENMRLLTNTFQIGGETNSYFFQETDSEDQVANFSSRGNVGVGLEGEFGRFKPDVVAPGGWVISCRSSTWQDPTNLVSFDVNRDVDQFIDRHSTNFYFRTIPDNATAFLIRVLRNAQSPGTIPPLEIHTNFGSPPAVNLGDLAGTNVVLISPVSQGQIHFAIVNNSSIGVHYDLLTGIVSTNEFGDYFVELKKLNDRLKPYYRFESGTSMAAPVVSGTLALMQEFFEQRLGRTNSPALMKALLINGARSLPCTGCDYDLQVRKDINNQGWGSIRLTNSIPKALDLFRTDSNKWPVIMFDQDPKNALATGESHTYNITLNTRARFEPLMVTLVWTDPPGNPVASAKLVNDLDLIVTNTTPGGEGEYFIGNHIPHGADFNEPIFVADSNAPPFDVVNNVENVFIKNNETLGQTYSIIVRARRVNVNAVTAQTNGIRQDYALVISSGNSSLSNTFNVTLPLSIAAGGDGNPLVQTLSNKVAKFEQRVGANSPLLSVVPSGVPGPSYGNTNQWNFYVFNNTNATFTNIAFITFLAPDLSVPRVREADIDLYVTRDPNLTNLAPAVISGSRKSLTRGGTEMVILTGADAPTGEFWVGVKSEDQQAASYAIFVIAQQKPFGDEDENGNIRLDFIDVNGPCIPDGSPERPGGARFFAPVFSSRSPTVRRIILTNDVDHDLGGDLLGSFDNLMAARGRQAGVVLNNHRQFSGFQRFIYDDSGEDDIVSPFVRKSDGPGSLRDFEGRPANGLWQFVMVDNAPFHTGCVERIEGMIEPQQDTNTTGNGVLLTVGAGKWRYTTVDVPPGVTNMLVYVTQQAPTLAPLDVYIRRDVRPTLIDYDKKGRVNPPGGVVQYGRYDFPSLQSGRYNIGVFNPNSSAVTFRLRIEFQYSLRPLETFSYIWAGNALIPDDMTTNFVIGVTNARTVADVKVGVRIDHPRLSDLVLHLVSPEGTRILLTENRGLSLGTNYGIGVPQEFIVPINSNGDNNEFRTNIDTTVRQGVVRVNYDFFNQPDSLHVYYEGKKIFDSGVINGSGTFNIPYGPGTSTFVELVMNEGGSALTTLWTMTVSVTGPWNYAIFTDDLNLGGPIKFAFPPFSRFPTNITVFSNSFENVLAGLYDTNSGAVDGWTVRSNYVGIITDTNAAQSGSNFLALSHGMISRGITNIIPGHDYNLSFAHRKISSSPTQNVHVEVGLIQTPYANLSSTVVAQRALAVPKLRLCPGQDVAIISTNTAFTFGGPRQTAQGDTNDLVYGIPRYGLIGCWSSHPTVLDERTRASLPFYIGGGTNADGTAKEVLIAAPNEPGDYYLFLGVNDDDYGDNVNVFEVDLRWAQCQLASAEYIVGNSPTHFEGVWRTNWAGESLLFTGNPTTTNLAFRPDINTTILLDSVIIDEIIPSAHYLSEEPLAPLQGETALGNWTLEITDNRVGPPVVGTNVPTLLSWSLNFVYADGPNPIPLTNGIQFQATVRGAQVYYFVVSVPLEVNTNLIQFFSSGNNGGVELLYSPFGLPEGAVPPDPIAPLGEAFSPFGVSSNYPAGAAISPGRQYFLAIRNVDPNIAANDFLISVDFLNVPITPLVPNSPGANGTIPPLPASFLQTRANSSIAVANMHYFSYDVGSADPLATNALFELASPGRNDDVHLVISRALPVSDLFPRPTFYEYHSTERNVPDYMIITANSIPVKLAPGRWYLGVYNEGIAPADYLIHVLESQAQIGAVAHLDIGANNHVTTNFIVTGSSALANFYHFTTDQTNAAVLFEIFNLTDFPGNPPTADFSADADLLVRRGDYPTRDLYDFSFKVHGPKLTPPSNTGYEPIPLRTNVFIPTLGVDTNWYLVIADESFVATGDLCITVFNNLNPIVGCNFNARFNAPVVSGGPFDVCWDSQTGNTYDVENTTDLINWAPVPGLTSIAATPPQNCSPMPTNAPVGFFRIRAY